MSQSKAAHVFWALCLCVYVCVCGVVCAWLTVPLILWGFPTKGIWANHTAVLCWGGIVLHFLSSVQSLPVPAPQSPSHSSQDDEGFAGAVVGLERGGATGCASGCVFSGWMLEGLGCWEGVLGTAGWGWLTWTESWGRCWATAAGLARMSCGVGRPPVSWTVGVLVAGFVWMSCVMWPDELACMSVASWLAGMVMMVIFSPAFEPVGNTVGRAWMTSLGGALADALATVTGTPVVRMEEEFNVTWPSELVIITGIAWTGLGGKKKTVPVKSATNVSHLYLSKWTSNGENG